MKTYHCFLKKLFLLFLLGTFSCSPSKLAKDTMGEIKKGETLLPRKVKKFTIQVRIF